VAASFRLADVSRRRAVIGLVFVTALAAAVVAAAVLVSSGGGDERPAPSGGAAAAPDVGGLYAGIPQDGVRLGDPDAPLTLLEFADLQCPFCAQYSVEVMPSVVRDYVRRGRVRYELRIRAYLGRDSVRAAGAAAVAARTDRLYEFADLFYRNQGAENSGYVTNEFVRGIAEQILGLPVDRVVAAANDPLGQPLVHRAQALAERVGSSGTPDFFVRKSDGRLRPLEPQGTTPEAFAAALDAALG
jgi:protein-disulfide isomerase